MRSLSRVCLVLSVFIAIPLFAQVSDVQPGSQDPGNACDDVGQYHAATGNPAPEIELRKNCSTATLAYAYADIVSSLEGGPVSSLTSAGFDIRNQSHCGAGAPRFQLVLDGGTIFVITLGCASGTRTDLGNGWTRVTFNAAQIAAAVATAGGTPASTITDMYILFDEGSDSPVVPYNTTQGSPSIGTPGLAFIDNIMVNGAVFGGATEAGIPTASEWGLLALASMLAVAGVVFLRR